MITVLCARGIGEPLTENMLSHVTRMLPADRFNVIEIPYPAEYGPVPGLAGKSFDASLAELRRLVLWEIVKAPGRVVLLGYSAGAAGMGDIAAEIALGLHMDATREMGWPAFQALPIAGKIAGVGLVADPRMPTGLDPLGRPMWGIAGSRVIPADYPVWWVADPADPIPCLEVDSPLRTVADQTDAMSLTDPVAWGLSLFARLQFGQWQAVAIRWWDRESVIRQYSAAFAALQRYVGRDHVSYSTRKPAGDVLTYCERLAENIIERLGSA